MNSPPRPIRSIVGWDGHTATLECGHRKLSSRNLSPLPKRLECNQCEPLCQIVDQRGSRWVDQPRRKRRAPARALRFVDLKAGDVLIHRQKFTTSSGVPRLPSFADVTLANDNRKEETKVVCGLAIAEHLWFDPVAGESNPTAGQMVAVRRITEHGRSGLLWRHTLRGLAQQGFHFATPGQSALILAAMHEREALLQKWKDGLVSDLPEERLALKPWRTLMRDLDL